MTTTTIQVELVHATCPNCSITYGIPEALYDQRRLDAKDGTIWCPNGHRWCYSGRSHEQEVARLKAIIGDERDYATRQRDRADANHRTSTALKGHVTRLRNRAAEGRCQWCNTVWPDVAQHVAERHPDRVNDDQEDGTT